MARPDPSRFRGSGCSREAPGAELGFRAGLPLERCPHCASAQPQLARINERENNRRGGHRRWGVYECLTCGGLVVAVARAGDPAQVIIECYPLAPDDPSEAIPARPREYLRQARDLLGQPTGSVMLSASAVDAMLKEKGLKEGRLYERIHDAVEQHLIGEDVAQWATYPRPGARAGEAARRKGRRDNFLRPAATPRAAGGDVRVDQPELADRAWRPTAPGRPPARRNQRPSALRAFRAFPPTVRTTTAEPRPAVVA